MARKNRTTPPMATPERPPRQVASMGTTIKNDTPAKPKASSGPEYRAGGLEASRDAVMEDLSHHYIPQLSVERFRACVLPESNFSKTQVEAVEKHLGCENNVGLIGNWANFDVAKGNEGHVFSALQNAFVRIVGCNEIQSTIKEKSLQRAVYVNDPNRAPTSARDDATRPDSFIKCGDSTRSVKSSELHSWYDIYVSFEFKPKDIEKGMRDDIRKVLWSMHHILRSDPCRRFTFGITVEHRNMRMWYASLACVLVSEAFDFIGDYSSTIKMFLSLGFATQTQAGWDQTFVFHKTLNTHIITIKGKKYTVESIIFDAGADTIIGRACRVFLCADEDGRKVAIKDVWINEDRKLVHEIWESIKEEVIRKYTLDRWENEYRENFFTYEASELVPEPDNSRRPLRHLSDQELAKGERFQIQSSTGEPLAVPRPSSVGAVPALSEHHDTRAPPVAEDISQTIQHRKHYRTVILEVATPLHNISELRIAWNVISVIMRIVMLLSEICYVHRDISTGNSFSYNKRVILGDLEYAKEMGTGGNHELRPGTRDFIAVEVAVGGYEFRPSQVQARTPMDDLIQKLKDTFAAAPNNDPPEHPESQAQKLFFFRNPLHESESVWWMAMKIFFMNEIRGSKDDNSWNRKRQIKQYYLMFPSRDTAGRHRFFKNYELDGFDKDASNSLAMAIQPIFQFLSFIHTEILGAYHQAEKRGKIDDTAWDRDFFDNLLLILGTPDVPDLKLVPLWKKESKHSQT